ncbi:hypothetical protein AQJ30_15490 [Streptomyces longwoodensis]|uniref:DUF1360 domain-containing protein n=1 Tax=Streptomyces longwoodensis TaxID=68231 RepID=A0A101QXR8_9ACTN|nr:DUF1360 domain-containing protein [Streptomyces longwoodensis]KUN37686.1 hypothetical protein AQJ30_15490 [Streptomyces longwoodensis]
MISLPVLALLGFAAYRATQLGVHDTILDGPRQRLGLWHAKKVDSRARGFIVQLVSCIYCFGFWLSGLTLLVYLLATDSWGDAPWLVHGIEWFAVAGAQALANRFDDSLGH